MLVTLRVRNFVLIDKLELAFGSGLNVLTGETGAGKSILVDALGLLLGGRASADVIRAGSTEAEVEALFDISDIAPLKAHIEKAGLTSDDELIIRRVVQQGGRSRAYINGRLSTVAELAQMGPLLLDIASQHESVSLTDPSTHLEFLDAFARLDDDRNAVAREVDALNEVVKQLRAEAERIRGRAEREAFLRFQLTSIEEVNPRVGEVADLLTERGRLRHASKLLDIAARACAVLDGDEGSLADEVGRIGSEISYAASIDAELGPLAESLEGARSELLEVARALSRYAEGIEADPSRLEQVEERLFSLEKLQRQHGPALEDVIATRDRLRTELDALGSIDARLEKLEADRAARLGQASDRARVLSKKRADAASKLAEGITRELASLGMGSAKIVVDVAPLPALSSDDSNLAVDGARLSRDGIDRVEFLIAPNRGVEPRPLRKVASGGELSRALLALKRVLADIAPAGSYVFDEVDTGVGGAIAERIGRALADVARHRQVLCITHLAPIAAFGTTHFVVEKGVSGETTRSTISEISGKARVHEIARMLSGATVTDAARKAASEMIREAASTPAPQQINA